MAAAHISFGAAAVLLQYEVLLQLKWMAQRGGAMSSVQQCAKGQEGRQRREGGGGGGAPARGLRVVR